MMSGARLFAALVLACGVLLGLTTCGPLMVSARSALVARSGAAAAAAAAAAATASPVVLDFYIMAKCPDAEACVNTFYPALHPLIDIVDVRVSYIAEQLAPGSFSCMHGPTECEGTIDQLCVQHLYPKNLTWFDYLNCEELTRTAIPGNGPACAAQFGISQPAIDLCHNSIGDSLFNQSIARTDAAQQTVSCTMNLNNAFWCQHNGGWVNCTEGTDVPSLTKAICARYQGANKPAACSALESTETVVDYVVDLEAQMETVMEHKIKASMRSPRPPMNTLRFSKD